MCLCRHNLTVLWKTENMSSVDSESDSSLCLMIIQGWRGIKDLTLGDWRQYQPLSVRRPSHNRPLVLFCSSNQLEVLGSHYLRLSCIGFLPRSIFLKPFFCRQSLITDYFGQPLKSCTRVCVSLCLCLGTWTAIKSSNHTVDGCWATACPLISLAFSAWMLSCHCSHC